MESEMGLIESAGIGGRINGVGGKRRKPSSSSSQGGEVCTTIDRISDLPESIILHILSLIPTYDAFKTSLLSKRWKLYWTKVSKFEFAPRFWPENRHTDFAGFVNMVLANQTYEYIHDLKLWWSTSKLEPGGLVATAICGSVRRLDLESRMDTPLPDALFTCPTLEYLRLIGPFVVDVSDCAVCLPKLSEMVLCNVAAESNESLPKLLSGCPVLQTLEIEKRKWYDTTVLISLISNISSASLKSLTVCIPYKPWWRTDPDITLEIDAPALRLLHITDHLSGNFSVRGGMNQLEDGRLDVLCLPGREDMFARMVEAFRGVKILMISEETMRAISISKPTPSFERVIALKITFERPGWPSPVDMMDSCFSLQYLYIFNWPDASGLPGDSSVYDLVRIPGCMSSSLRFVAFSSLEEPREEMALLKFILLHGRVLDTVYLWYMNDYPSDSERRRDILNQVSMLPKASPSCKILEWNPRLVLDWVGQ